MTFDEPRLAEVPQELWVWNKCVEMIKNMNSWIRKSRLSPIRGPFYHQFQVKAHILQWLTSQMHFSVSQFIQICSFVGISEPEFACSLRCYLHSLRTADQSPDCSRNDALPWCVTFSPKCHSQPMHCTKPYNFFTHRSRRWAARLPSCNHRSLHSTV